MTSEGTTRNASAASLKKRLARRELMVGTWLKTPSHIVTEVLARTELDLLCLDAEHAPFDRLALDTCVMACRCHDMPVLIRPPSSEPEHLLNALDIGADGVIVPHTLRRQDALRAVKNSHYGPEGRGYAGSSRAAGYTQRKMADHLAASRSTVVIVQVEDREGLQNITEIADCPSLDCLFIGRADLAVSLGKTSLLDPEVVAACERICDVARERCAVGMFIPDLEELPRWIELGVTLFLLESDHVFLLRGAHSLVSAIRERTRACVNDRPGN